MSRPTTRPAAFKALLGLLVFQGVSAIPAGLLLIVDPTGAKMHMPLSMLRDSPFRDFLIPGLILGVGLGLGAFLVAAGLFFLPALPLVERLSAFKGTHWSRWAAITFGLALMIWILVQVAIMGAGSWLQVLYFAVGLAVVGLAFTPSVRTYLAAGRGARGSF